MQMIRRWKGMENVQLFASLVSFEILYSLGAVLKINISVFWTFTSGGQYFGDYFQTAYRNVTNDMALER